MRKYPTGATRDDNAHKLSFKGFFSPHVKHEFARYMQKHQLQKDGKKREPDNWKKGIPIDDYADALLRHVEELHLLYETSNTPDQIKDKLCAVIFNCNGWLHSLLTSPVAIYDPQGSFNQLASYIDEGETHRAWNSTNTSRVWNLGTNEWASPNHTKTDNNPED
jgi:hypothetical protein